MTDRIAIAGRRAIAGRAAVSGRAAVAGRLKQNCLAPYRVKGLVYWMDPSRYATTVAGVPAFTLAGMDAVTSTGTSPPVLTLTGTATAAINISVRCTSTGSESTALIDVSYDAGVTYALTGIHPNAGFVQLGITGSFAAGTYTNDNVWTSNVRVSTVVSLESSFGIVNANLTATQATASSHPTLKMADASYNNQPTLNFAETLGGTLILAATLSLTQPCTIVIVGNSTADGITTTNSPFTWASGGMSVNQTTGLFNVNFGSGVNSLVTVVAKKIVAIVINGATSQIIVGGPVTSLKAGALGATNPGLTRLGSATAHGNWNGPMADVLIYNRALSLTELDFLCRVYLAPKHGATWL